MIDIQIFRVLDVMFRALYVKKLNIFIFYSQEYMVVVMNSFSHKSSTTRRIEDMMAGSIITELETANTQLASHVIREGKILGLDKNCDYCRIYFEY
ncbi:MAG: hypothetical protein WBQ25_22340 [Nitrososphaeraceae archaeon]|jgi:hypothetical protein